MSLTPKQEAFVRAYIETGNACEAYRRAYDAGNMKDTAIKTEALRLLKHPTITLALDKSRAKHQNRHEITIDKLTSMAVAAYDLAMKDDVQAPAAAVSALLAIGKLHGLVVDKKEVTRKRDASDLTIDELYAIASMGRSGDSAANAGQEEPDSIH